MYSRTTQPGSNVICTNSAAHNDVTCNWQTLNASRFITLHDSLHTAASCVNLNCQTKTFTTNKNRAKKSSFDPTKPLTVTLDILGPLAFLINCSHVFLKLSSTDTRNTWGWRRRTRLSSWFPCTTLTWCGTPTSCSPAPTRPIPLRTSVSTWGVFNLKTVRQNVLPADCFQFNPQCSGSILKHRQSFLSETYTKNNSDRKLSRTEISVLPTDSARGVCQTVNFHISFWLTADSDQYTNHIPNPKHTPKYTKAKVPLTQDKQTSAEQLSRALLL